VYYFDVIRRFYVHNFRCLENFELPIAGYSSALLIGRNGAGKTTVGMALNLLRKIAQGTNRVGSLIGPGDLTKSKVADSPIRLEIEAEVRGAVYSYSIAFERPVGFQRISGSP
jgi:ABC-type branched-subunit amino acid transport system ATPase component